MKKRYSIFAPVNDMSFYSDSREQIDESFQQSFVQNFSEEGDGDVVG
eukprot:CAMPEP_0170475144 /NCGR_PEP_ID=MMETSP0123-20130129/16848_1 /TAXON_ID=182087 /ORGANISM="Favella ehrenbergii, Strain Fehren 1" /LENGTH=46 /DNA_ID= /DNA_START= /DNA_END= /DNA_ORIENTATION=